MDSCFTCEKYTECTTRLGCNLVGCAGWEPIGSLIETCKNCANECNDKIKERCVVLSKYIGFYRTLKYKRKS